MGHQEHFSTDMSNVSAFNVVYVTSLNAFPDSVANIITLDSLTHYSNTRPVNVNTDQLKIPDNGTIQFSTTNAITNALSTDLTGSTAFFIGEIARLEIENVNIVSNNSAGTLWDLSLGSGVPGGIVVLNDSTAQRFDSLGTLDGLNFFSENTGLLLNGAGYTFNNMALIQIAEARFSAQTGDHINITGTLAEGTFDKVVATPKTGDAVFNISATITNRINITNSLFSDTAGGTLFAAGSKDQTDPKVISFNNGNALDSYWVGSMGFQNNTTPTGGGVGSQGVLFDIAGAMTAGVDNERYTVEDNVMTYIGEEDIKVEADVRAAASRTTPAASGRTLRLETLVDSGSGFVIKPESNSMTITGNRANMGTLTKPFILKKGHKIKGQGVNESSNDPFLVIDYTLSLRKA